MVFHSTTQAQVKLKEQIEEGLNVTLAWLKLLPVKNPIETITILAFYLKSFAERENELTWVNRSVRQHASMCVNEKIAASHQQLNSRRVGLMYCCLALTLIWGVC